MFRTSMTIALVVLMSGFLAVSAQNTKTEQSDKSGKKQQATITKVDAKNGTVTVRMKDKNGKDVDRVFSLTGDIRYFDSTGKAVAVDVFRNDDDVLVFEAEGRLRELHQHANQATGQTGKTDGDFLKTAAIIDLAEIKLGKLAQERATGPMIKKFGEKLLADHKKMNEELRQMAKNQGMKLPQKLDQEHQELYDKLSKLQGAEFDRAYAKDMVSGHEKALMKFMTEAKTGQDAELKAWAERWVPTLQEHLKMARTAAKEAGQ